MTEVYIRHFYYLIALRNGRCAVLRIAGLRRFTTAGALDKAYEILYTLDLAWQVLRRNFVGSRHNLCRIRELIDERLEIGRFDGVADILCSSMFGINNTDHIAIIIKERTTAVAWLNRCGDLVLHSRTLKTRVRTDDTCSKFDLIAHSSGHWVTQNKDRLTYICQ